MCRSSHIFRIRLRISTTPRGSRPLTGSSRISNSGLPMSAIAIPRRCFIPREKSFTFLLPVKSRPVSSSSSPSSSLFGIPRMIRWSFIFSWAVMLPLRPGYSIRLPILFNSSCISLSLLWPNSSRVPLVGKLNPAMSRINVVLPAPFLPMSPYIFPVSSVMDTSFKAVKLRYFFVS